MKKLLTIYLVLLLCASAFAIPRKAVRDAVGNYTGPITGTDQNDNIKSALDLLHSKLFGTGTGNVFFVDSGATAGGADGGSWTNAVLTLDAGNNLCSDNNGDVLLAAAGHAEDITAAAGAVMDVNGVQVRGMCQGSLRPTLTFTTTTSADIDIGGNSVSIFNFRFIGDIDGALGPIDVGAAYFSMIDCEFIDLGTDNALRWIQTDASADNMLIQNCNLAGTATAGNVAWISLVGCDQARIIDCEAYGDFSSANILMETTTRVQSRRH